MSERKLKEQELKAQKVSCLSARGCLQRQKTMEQSETGNFRLCHAGIYIIASVLCFAIGGTQASRAVNATSINADYSTALPNFDNAYDSCAIGQVELGSNQAEDPCETSECKGTGWTFVWQFNAAIMIIMGANFIILIAGSFNYKARFGGTILNFALAFLNIIGSISALDSYNRAGYFCTLNNLLISEYDDQDQKFVTDGHTYADDGETIFFFAVIQIILGSIQCVCCGCPLLCIKAGGPNGTKTTFEMTKIDRKTKENSSKHRHSQTHEPSSYGESSQSEMNEQVLVSVEENYHRQEASPEKKIKHKSSNSQGRRRNKSLSVTNTSVYSADEALVMQRQQSKNKGQPALKQSTANLRIEIPPHRDSNVFKIGDNDDRIVDMEQQRQQVKRTTTEGKKKDNKGSKKKVKRRS